MPIFKQCVFLAVSLSLLVACGDDFQPRTSLQEVRVLSMEATPLEVGLGEAVTVQSVIHVPSERSVASYKWTYCPINLGAVAGYQCIDAACEVEITTTSYSDPVTVTPSDSLFACLGVLAEKAESGEAQEADSIDPDTIAKIDTALFLEITDDEGRVFRQIKTIPLWKEKPEVINQAPVVSDVLIDGVSALGTNALMAQREAEIEVRVVVDPESMGTYLNSRSEVVDEEAIISFYATAGVFAADRKDGFDVTNSLEFAPSAMESEPWEPPLALGPDVTSIDIYTVVRDGQGGQTASGPFTIDLSSAP
ncbi:MAG: hypothetical protein HOK97_10210 [Deltaproteobacteria bacterium]|nr:hypothetical protein [Deltaproteobacteria bacterium]